MSTSCWKWNRRGWYSSKKLKNWKKRRQIWLWATKIIKHGSNSLRPISTHWEMRFQIHRKHINSWSRKKRRSSSHKKLRSTSSRQEKDRWCQARSRWQVYLRTLYLRASQHSNSKQRAKRIKTSATHQVRLLPWAQEQHLHILLWELAPLSTDKSV